MLCALSLGVLSVSVEAQSGQARANYEKAVASLKDIGPGAAAALQVYRYESARLDLTSDANAVVFGEAAKTNRIAGRIDLIDATCDFAVAQIDTDVKIIIKIAKRPGATKDDIRRKEKAETALHDFIALVGTTPTALQSPLQRAVRKVAGEVNQEEFAAMFLVASDKKPAIIALPAPASTAREQYDNMVRLSHDGFGAAAANALQALRYFREPVDSFRDEAGRPLFDEDRQALLAQKKTLEMSIADIFPVQVLFNLLNLNETSPPGFDVRRENARKALKAFVAAGGGDPAAAGDNFAKAGTIADDSNVMANRADAPHRLTLLKELAEAANAILNRLIEGENHQNASAPSPTGPGQDSKRTGPNEARYEQAVALLKEIGPGAAAVMQTYRYQSAPMDLTMSDEKDGVAITKYGEGFGVNEATLNIAATQIATEMTDLRKMGSRPDATNAEIQHEKDGEKAFQKFLSLGGDNIGNGDDEATKVQKTIRKVVLDANMELGQAMYQAASNQNPGIINVPPPTGSAKEQYENMVKLLTDGLGTGAASALQAVRYAREPADSFNDAAGNPLYPQDAKSIQTIRIPIDLCSGVLDVGLNSHELIANNPPRSTGLFMASFGAQVWLDAVNLNEPPTPGFQTRQLNARNAVKAFVAAGGGNPATADDNFIRSDTPAADREISPAQNARMALADQMDQAANKIINNLIKEEHSSGGRTGQTELRRLYTGAGPAVL
jgi:hypothetical protein